MMRKIIFVTALLLTVFIGGVWLYTAPYNDGIIIIEKQVFVLDKTRDERERTKGLGGRHEMCTRCGMLFHFDGARALTFWMKEMLIDIDMVWIRDNHIVDISHEVPIFPPEKKYSPQTSADTVLELPAGATKKYKIKIGDRVHIY